MEEASGKNIFEQIVSICVGLGIAGPPMEFHGQVSSTACTPRSARAATTRLISGSDERNRRYF
jgi:hypothetical protein